MTAIEDMNKQWNDIKAQFEQIGLTNSMGLDSLVLKNKLADQFANTVSSLTAGDLVIPVAIKIGAITYTVEQVQRLQSADGRNLNGHVLYDQALVKIDVDLAPAVKAVCLCHEAVHAIIDAAGYDHSEGMATALGYGIAALIKDNPDLVKYIQENL